jgi:hypothetical protein
VVLGVIDVLGYDPGSLRVFTAKEIPAMLRCSAALVVVFSFLASPLTSGEKKPAVPIMISWHGQSFFTLKTSKGTTIVMDPHAIMEYGRVQGLKADIVLVSHNHNDHTQIGVIENIKDKDVKIITGLKGGGFKADWNPVDEEVKDVRIRSVGVYHDNVEGMKYGKTSISSSRSTAGRSSTWATSAISSIPHSSRRLAPSMS